MGSIPHIYRREGLSPGDPNEVAPNEEPRRVFPHSNRDASAIDSRTISGKTPNHCAPWSRPLESVSTSQRGVRGKKTRSQVMGILLCEKSLLRHSVRTLSTVTGSPLGLRGNMRTAKLNREQWFESQQLVLRSPPCHGKPSHFAATDFRPVSF